MRRSEGICLECWRAWDGECECATKAARNRESQRMFWAIEKDGRRKVVGNNLAHLTKRNEGVITGAMIKPLGNRVLVKLLSRYGDLEDKHKLIIVDGKKHYEGLRKGEVMAVGPWVKSVSLGDIVIFRGDSGESFSVDSRGINDGTDWRRLRISDVLAVEVPVEDLENLSPHAVPPRELAEARP